LKDLLLLPPSRALETLLLGVFLPSSRAPVLEVRVLALSMVLLLELPLLLRSL